MTTPDPAALRALAEAAKRERCAAAGGGAVADFLLAATRDAALAALSRACVAYTRRASPA